jgi:hypothetical protein
MPLGPFGGCHVKLRIKHTANTDCQNHRAGLDFESSVTPVRTELLNGLPADKAGSPVFYPRRAKTLETNFAECLPV